MIFDGAPARTLWLVADQTSASIDIAARPDEIMAVIADFEHYPDWVDSMQSAEVLSFVDGKAKTVRMVLDHKLVKDNGAKTTVTYTLTVDINMPMIRMFKRRAEKTIIDGALKGLKKRVEG